MAQNVVTISAGMYVESANSAWFSGTPLSATSGTFNSQTSGLNTTSSAPTTTAAGNSWYVVSDAAAYMHLQSAGSLAGVVGQCGGGSMASPTATPSGTILCSLLARGHDGSAWNANNKGIAGFYTTELWSTTAMGCDYRVSTTATGTLTRAVRLTVSEAGLAVVGGAGFNGASVLAKPTITGSRGGNAALASLLTALASYGLITDSTTA